VDSKAGNNKRASLHPIALNVLAILSHKLQEQFQVGDVSLSILGEESLDREGAILVSEKISRLFQMMLRHLRPQQSHGPGMKSFHNDPRIRGFSLHIELNRYTLTPATLLNDLVAIVNARPCRP
jgi:hypothetical protein